MNPLKIKLLIYKLVLEYKKEQTPILVTGNSNKKIFKLKILYILNVCLVFIIKYRFFKITIYN